MVVGPILVHCGSWPFMDSLALLCPALYCVTLLHMAACYAGLNYDGLFCYPVPRRLQPCHVGVVRVFSLGRNLRFTRQVSSMSRELAALKGSGVPVSSSVCLSIKI